MVQPPYGQPPYGQPPYGGQPAYGGAPINNNMGLAIAGLLLFWPVGLIALLRATKVNSMAQMGDVMGAQQNADDAKKFGKMAIYIGIGWYALVSVCCCLYFIFAVVLAGSSSTYS